MRHPVKMVARILLILLPVLLLFSAGYGCGSNTDTPQKVFMWKITSGTTYVYILGTVQVKDESIYPMNSVIENAFNNTDDFVVGVNTKNIDQSETEQYVSDYGMYAVGEGLNQNIPDSLYSQLEQFKQKHGVDLTTYERYKPWVVYNVMGQVILLDLGYKTELEMETYFINKAETADKNIIEMETAISRWDLMSSVPDAANFAMMAYDADNPETGQDLEDIFDAWKNGDAEKMESLVFKPKNEAPDTAPYFDNKYDARNPNLVSKIEGLLAGNQTHFVVVNAGNLLGKNGILSLLKTKGYLIEQVYTAK